MRWLDAEGQDVQLHTHPEYLPKSFWADCGLSARPEYMNQYTDDSRAEFVLKHFGGLISGITGKELRAFRAGSFRWNACTIRALNAAAIPLSFNNSMCAVHAKQSPYGEPTNLPYRWSNGVIEVPTTEKRILPKLGKDEWWARLTYPESSYFRFRPWWGKLLLDAFSGGPDFSVFCYILGLCCIGMRMAMHPIRMTGGLMAIASLCRDLPRTMTSLQRPTS